MPIPCINCVRFHYGPCREKPKFCFVCGGLAHIERYCPSERNTIQPVHGEPLAGTKPWCEMHGLQHNSGLKQKVLQSLKVSPGTAIHINGLCIYRGHEKNFVYEVESRGRSLEDRIGNRRRSRSPRDDRFSRSTPGFDERTSGSTVQNTINQRSYRWRSATRCQERRRTPPPYRNASPPLFYQTEFTARSPHLASSSCAMVYEANNRRHTEQYPNHLLIKGLGARLHDIESRRGREGPPYFSGTINSIPRALRTISCNGRTSTTPLKAQQFGDLSPPRSRQRITGDPHFVFGAAKDAEYEEINIAKQRIKSECTKFSPRG